MVSPAISHGGVRHCEGFLGDEVYPPKAGNLVYPYFLTSRPACRVVVEDEDGSTIFISSKVYPVKCRSYFIGVKLYNSYTSLSILSSVASICRSIRAFLMGSLQFYPSNFLKTGYFTFTHYFAYFLQRCSFFIFLY